MADDPTLCFEDVTIEGAPPFEGSLRGAGFSLGAGELVLVIASGGDLRLPLADAAEGLTAPARGVVRFVGSDWQTMKPEKAAGCRGRIGRVFDAHGWISNLDMDENILLPQRHHTLKPDPEIEQAAEALARQFGFDALPHVRPARLKKSELRRMEWIRAFLGEPALIVLENPLRDVYFEAARSLADAIRSARARGAAVLWVNSDLQALDRGGLDVSRAFEWNAVSGEWKSSGKA